MQELAVTTPAMSAGSVTIPATTCKLHKQSVLSTSSTGSTLRHFPDRFLVTTDVVKESAPLFIVPAIGNDANIAEFPIERCGQNLQFTPVFALKLSNVRSCRLCHPLRRGDP